MIEVLLIIHLIICASMVAVVLLQKSEGGALGIGGGGGGGGFLTGRGTANLLTRTTAGLAAGFFATSILLSIMAGRGEAPASRFTAPPPASSEAPSAPTSGGAPATGGGGVLDKLKSGQGGQRLPTIPQSQ
ncbi:MAG: preprotein translocase subunit SecG [Hyphomicrobiaceae bacterium]